MSINFNFKIQNPLSHTHTHHTHSQSGDFFSHFFYRGAALDIARQLSSVSDFFFQKFVSRSPKLELIFFFIILPIKTLFKTLLKFLSNFFYRNNNTSDYDLFATFKPKMSLFVMFLNLYRKLSLNHSKFS